jgi:hypothetical protein
MTSATVRDFRANSCITRERMGVCESSGGLRLFTDEDDPGRGVFGGEASASRFPDVDGFPDSPFRSACLASEEAVAVVLTAFFFRALVLANGVSIGRVLRDLRSFSAWTELSLIFFSIASSRTRLIARTAPTLASSCSAVGLSDTEDDDEVRE